MCSPFRFFWFLAVPDSLGVGTLKHSQTSKNFVSFDLAPKVLKNIVIVISHQKIFEIWPTEQAEIRDFDLDFLECKPSRAKTAKIPYDNSYMAYRLGQVSFDSEADTSGTSLVNIFNIVFYLEVGFLHVQSESFYGFGGALERIPPS